MPKTGLLWTLAVFVSGLLAGSCGAPTSAPVEINVKLVVEHCPLITTWNVSPLQVSSPNGTIDVSVTASDGIDGNPLSYSWTATAGSFSDVSSPMTVYRCTTPGAQTLALTVTDDHRRVPCADAGSYKITCVAP